LGSGVGIDGGSGFCLGAEEERTGSGPEVSAGFTRERTGATRTGPALVRAVA
jgi:hypothetical protein